MMDQYRGFSLPCLRTTGELFWSLVGLLGLRCVVLAYELAYADAGERLSVRAAYVGRNYFCCSH